MTQINRLHEEANMHLLSLSIMDEEKEDYERLFEILKEMRAIAAGETPDMPPPPEKGIPVRIVKEAQLLHDCLKERGHLNINELLSFLQRVITARPPRTTRAVKTRAAKTKEELFLYHYERLSKPRKKRKS